MSAIPGGERVGWAREGVVEARGEVNRLSGTLGLKERRRGVGGRPARRAAAPCSTACFAWARDENGTEWIGSNGTRCLSGGRGTGTVTRVTGGGGAGTPV